ncbi:MAG: bL21 family ribosomal protein [bacterium]
MSFVVESGSKQYMVELGQQFAVDKLIDAQEGDVLEFPAVFAFGADKGKTSLRVRVVGHAQGDKVRVVKYRAKSNYHVQSGFRAQQTVLEVVDENAKTEKKVEAKVEEKEVKSEVEKKVTSEKKEVKDKSETKKPVVKKTTKAVK